MSNKSIFKPYLFKTAEYEGGKGTDEVRTKASTLYKLSSNENPIGTSPKALEAIQNSLQDLHIYPPRTGIALQAALSEFYDYELSEAHFVPTNSGSEAIEFIARGFLSDGLECIVSNPSFMPYTMFSGWNGAKVVDVPLLAPNYELDVQGILNAINENTRLIFLCSPNNPTGTYLPKSKIDELVNHVPDYVIIVLDEVYYHFADAEDFTTAMPYVKAGKKMIGVNSFSKTYGLAALRVGYSYSTPEIAGYLRRLYRPFLINKIGLCAGIAALKDKAFMDEVIELVQTERQRFYPVFEALGVPYWKGQGNFILFKPPMDADEFVEKMIYEAGVMVREAGSSGAPDCLRVTIGTKEANDAFFEGLSMICV
jgi:histidinol-phosphate aminotransferase